MNPRFQRGLIPLETNSLSSQRSQMKKYIIKTYLSVSPLPPVHLSTNILNMVLYPVVPVLTFTLQITESPVPNTEAPSSDGWLYYSLSKKGIQDKGVVHQTLNIKIMSTWILLKL